MNPAVPNGRPGPAALRVLAEVAIATAPGPGHSAVQEIDVSEVPDQRDLVNAAAQERLTGPLVRAVQTGLLRLDDDVVEKLVDVHVDAMAWCLRVESRLWAITGWLEDVDVRALVVKGPAVAHLDEIDPSLRAFADLDLLVQADDLPAVLGALARRGAVRPFAERRRGFDQRFAKSVTVTFPDRIEIDVHRTICDGVHAVRLPVERLHRSPDSFDLGGHEVLTPNRTVRTLHAAYHAVLGSPSPRLVSLRDIVGYLRSAEREGSVEKIATEAERWRGTAVLAQAVREVQAAGASLPEWTAWLERTTVDPEEDAVIAAQRRDGSSFRRSRITASRELPSVRDRVAYLAAAALPSTTHLRSRGRSRFGALRPGATTGERSVVLPDLPPPGGGVERVLVVLANPTPAGHRPAWMDLAATKTVHVVTRGEVESLRRILSETGVTATVTGTPRGRGLSGRLREVTVASGEVRRFTPDRVEVETGTTWLVCAALLTGRTRVVRRGAAGSSGPPSPRTRLDELLWRLVRSRNRPSSSEPGLH
ncbi:MAG: nucleotidyltransferase family protein [Acidimicrobiales bacterium]|nr:nucleotidyltransferase family protein [Acidimicrobiales bacterium]